MLSALGVDELGSHFGPVPGAWAFYWAAYKSSFNPASCAWEVGLHAYFLNSISYPPALGYDELAWARAVSFLELGATSTCLLRAGLVRDLSPSNVLWY